MTMSIFGERIRKEAVDSLITSLDRLLPRSGFKQSDRGEWTRKAGWKIEEVDLRVDDMSREGLQPAFRVAIPTLDISPVGDTYEYIAEEKLPRIIDPSVAAGTRIPIPSLGHQVDRFITQLSGDFERGLRWFDQFATPELFKANLAKFVRPGCPAYLNAEQFLNSVSKR